MDKLLLEYLPIIIFIAVGGALSLFLVVIPYLFAPQKPDAEKLSAYECGFNACAARLSGWDHSHSRAPFFHS